MKTYMQKTAEVKRDWHLVDVKDQVLGRISVEIALKLTGKNKPTYTPHIDGGDHVVVINAAQVAVTGNKEEGKLYRSHSGYVGNLKTETLAELRARRPEDIIRKAVFNMIPKNKLRTDRIARLKIYADAEHPHQSQLSEAKNG